MRTPAVALALQPGTTFARRLILETSLYLPVKGFLEARDFVVKGEIGGCDLVGVKAGEPPLVVVGELKLRFNLELVLQAVDRATSCDEVWIAARVSAKGNGKEGDARFRNLCRRLGFGMLGVSEAGGVEIILSPVAPLPRRDPKRRSRLVDEHTKRRGDPVLGGLTRQPIMTAYRQRSLLCAAAMRGGPRRPRDLAPEIPDAAKILYDNVYGWFFRIARGSYGLTPAGLAALERWPQERLP